MKEDNQAVIKALNMYGRVPEQWELLEEIERLKQDNEYLNKVNIELSTEKNRLNNIIDKAIKGIEDFYYGDEEYKKYDYTLAYKIYHILKGEDKE